MKKATLFIVPLLCSAALCSCVRDVTLDAMDKPTVAVECVLTNSSPQTLRLAFTKGASQAEASPLVSVEASLIDLSEGQVIGVFERGEDGVWTLDYAAVPEHNYRLEIDVPDYELIWAEQTMPALAELSCFSHIFHIYDNTQYYHKYPMFCGTVFYASSLPNYTWIYGMNYNEETKCFEIADEICTDYEYVDNFNLTGEVYTPETSDTDYSGFECYAELYPPLAGKSIHRRFLRLEKNDNAEEKVFVISGNFQGPYYSFLGGYQREQSETEGYVESISVTDDYDRYLRDAIAYQLKQESSDLSSIYQRENIYTNINGGVGIFGAQIKTKLQWMRAFSPVYINQLYED